MPQQYHSLSDTMYTDYRQLPSHPHSHPPPAYQDNYALMYSHSNFQHYHRSAIPSTGSSGTGHEYGQPYYSAASNSYGLLPPSYNSSCNMSSFAASNFHASSYSTSANFHHPSPPAYSSYENVTTSPMTLLSVKTEPIEQTDHINGSNNGGAMIKSSASPVESRSDRSESSFSSTKLDVCSKSDDALTELPDNVVGNTEQSECNMENNIYQSCGEENVSSKFNLKKIVRKRNLILFEIEFAFNV